MLDEAFGLVEVGVFQEDGSDATGFTMRLEAVHAARLLLVQLADPAWFEAQLFDLCSRAKERIEAVGVPDGLTGDLGWKDVADVMTVNAARGREADTPPRRRHH